MCLCLYIFIKILQSGNISTSNFINRYLHDSDFSLPNENIRRGMIKHMLWSATELKICIVEKV